MIFAAIDYNETILGPMQLNQGKFLINARCGVLKKPNPLTDRGITLDPFTHLAIDQTVPIELAIEVNWSE